MEVLDLDSKIRALVEGELKERTECLISSFLNFSANCKVVVEGGTIDITSSEYDINYPYAVQGPELVSSVFCNFCVFFRLVYVYTEGYKLVIVQDWGSMYGLIGPRVYSIEEDSDFLENCTNRLVAYFNSFLNKAFVYND